MCAAREGFKERRRQRRRAALGGAAAGDTQRNCRPGRRRTTDWLRVKASGLKALAKAVGLRARAGGLASGLCAGEERWFGLPRFHAQAELRDPARGGVTVIECAVNAPQTRRQRAHRASETGALRCVQCVWGGRTRPTTARRSWRGGAKVAFRRQKRDATSGAPCNPRRAAKPKLAHADALMSSLRAR